MMRYVRMVEGLLAFSLLAVLFCVLIVPAVLSNGRSDNHEAYHF